MDVPDQKSRRHAMAESINYWAAEGAQLTVRTTPKLDVGLLVFWADLGVQTVAARQRPRRNCDWDAVDAVITCTREVLIANGKELRGVIELSNDRLKPLADPLVADFGAHRWLADSREESYSDWLHWTVEQLKTPDLVLPLFEVDVPEDLSGKDVEPAVRREQWVPEGEPEREGRLDLRIEYPGQPLLVVEIKKTRAEDAYLRALKGYSRSLPRGSDRRLLVKKAEKPQYAGFIVCSWRHLALRLRRDALIVADLTVRAMILAFAGAVEQNLLGFSADAAGKAASGKPVLVTTGLLDYLKEAKEAYDC
jgi:hypothetical protein